RLKALEARVVEIQNAPPDPATLAAVEADRDVFTQTEAVNRVKRKIKGWGGIAAENSPGMSDLRKELAAEEAALKKVRQEKIAALEGNRKAEAMKKIRDEGSAVEGELNKNQEQLKQSRDRLARTQE